MMKSSLIPHKSVTYATSETRAELARSARAVPVNKLADYCGKSLLAMAIRQIELPIRMPAMTIQFNAKYELNDQY